MKYKVISCKARRHAAFRTVQIRNHYIVAEIKLLEINVFAAYLGSMISQGKKAFRERTGHGLQSSAAGEEGKRINVGR